MIQDAIREARKQAGLSQEELASQMHVVRQTVSKWERGLSVPDASMLPELARILQVPISRLLETGEQTADSGKLGERLAHVNEQLIRQQRVNRRLQSYSRRRELILFPAFLSLLIAMGVHNRVLSAVGITACALGSLMLLYRNLPLMTGTSEEHHLKPFRQTTVFAAGILILVTLGILAAEIGLMRLKMDQEKLLAWLLIVTIMTFAGWISPKLAWNRHVGLRLPWTVQDQETWNLAHRILGWISLPAAVFYTAAVLVFPDFGLVSAASMIVWLSIPSVISLIFWWKKYQRK